MYRAPFRPLCVILLASMLATVACKTAPQAPEFSSSEEFAAEMARLEAERAEIIEAQKQVDEDLKVAEEGWPEGKSAPKIQASYTSAGGKWDDEKIIDAKEQYKKASDKNDRAGAQTWLRKLSLLCKSRKQELTKVLVQVDIKIEDCKKNYGDVGYTPRKPPESKTVDQYEKPLEEKKPPYIPPPDAKGVTPPPLPPPPVGNPGQKDVGQKK